MSPSTPSENPSHIGYHASISSPNGLYEASTPTNHETLDNRRRNPKVSRACDPCKTKKIRCSGTLPCNTCSRRRLTCTYASRYGRGRPPTPPSLTPRNGADMIDRRGIGSETPVREQNEGEENERRADSDLVIEGQYFDLTSGLTFLHRAWSKLSAQRGQLMAYGSNDVERNQLLESAGDRPFYLENSTTEVLPDDLTVRGLVSLYFDSCVVTYRMFHRQTVESWLDVMLRNREQSHPLAALMGNAKASILLTILAIATFRSFKLQSTPSNDLPLSGLREGDSLFHAATGLTSSEMGYPRVESVQARLIQALYLLQTGRMSKAWYMFGNAYQIISSLGLHRKQFRQQNIFREQSDYIDQQCAKRVFWTAYTIDKYLSVVFGRPRLLHDVEIDQEFPDPINDEDMGSSGPLTSDASDECHISSLICHAKIARLIGRVSHEVYYVHDGRKANRAAAADNLLRELKEWHAELPPHLGTVKPSTLVPSFRREATAIQLAYCHAIIHATRPFLLGDGNTFSKEPTMQVKITECLSAARNAIEIVDRIARDKELSYSFWWAQYVLFCALAVIYVWEIQRKARQDACSIDASHERLFELAEKCRCHLQGGSSAAPPNYRYRLILDELRLEAQGGAFPNHNTRGISGVVDNAEHMMNGRPGFWGEQPLADENGDLDMSVNSVLLSGSQTLESWQTSDWLDLDSSVMFRLPVPCYPPANHLKAFYPMLNMVDLPL
ncbi:fungal-specific transcription factor domain-containing protein [Aspergillus granulosus]|uniref:Fungal-specific transcription factor domain-containing protein n=1 Tax=Aspergillus granulosus TaxID=176169 RepID=A0ABR4HMM6_9EURO